ncbi:MULTISPECIES: acyl carrier protein [Aliarcobacter]|uniref:acyl carrier protein n=1 Tax=Aliarcobacter TaxID=2321111 RepID=UPI00112F63D9|nr:MULTISPECIES: acyl carrier protein [Aliarcobacter]MDX4048457.1 acyl carrier protein [Aliarcobacter skirrowii]
MENRIKKVMSDILNIDVSSINDNTSPENVESWDSLKQMNIIVALEEEFDIEFSDEEIGEMLNYRLILEVLKEK